MGYTVIVLVVLLSLPCRAEGMLHVPLWTMVDGKACYEFLDAKKLLILDSDFEALLVKDSTQGKILVELKTAAQKFQEALDAEKRANVTLASSNKDLGERLFKETKRANDAEARPGPFPAWAIGAGVGIAVGVIAGIVLGVYVAK